MEEGRTKRGWLCICKLVAAGIYKALLIIEQVLDEPHVADFFDLACTLLLSRKLKARSRQCGRDDRGRLSRGEMEDELAARNIPVYYVDQEYWEQEKEAL